jgi:cytochrome c5
MKAQRKHSAVLWFVAASLALSVACGSNEVAGSPATGVALTDSPVQGTITLNDSSAPPQTRTVAMQADGQFSLDVDGLVPPFVLRADWTDDTGARLLYAVADGRENLDLHSISDVAFARACDGEDEHQVFDHSDSDRKRNASTSASALIVKLHTALAPLFERYGIANPAADKAAVRALLKDVQVTKDHGTVTVTNRATHGVIFVGLLSDLESGTFSAENMPIGPGGQPGTCTSFTYSAYGSCLPDSTQSRTVLTSLPASCSGGTPVITQACTYVPPVTTCTSFTYSAYGACQADNSQSRTVLTSLPASCSGGTPVTSQACTYVPPGIDGLALYNQYCSGCHGNRYKGAAASDTKSAIDNNTGGMGSAALRALTPAQLDAIAAAP